MPWRLPPVRPPLILVAAAAAGAALWLQATAWSGAQAARAADARGTEVVGAVHVHTTHSDGALDIAGVVEEGRAAGLDFPAGHRPQHPLPPSRRRGTTGTCC